MGQQAQVMGRRRTRIVVYDLPDEEVLETTLYQNFKDYPEKEAIRKELTPVHKFSTIRTLGEGIGSAKSPPPQESPPA